MVQRQHLLRCHLQQACYSPEDLLECLGQAVHAIAAPAWLQWVAATC
jgi:hypothetical protein